MRICSLASQRTKKPKRIKPQPHGLNHKTSMLRQSLLAFYRVPKKKKKNCKWISQKFACNGARCIRCILRCPKSMLPYISMWLQHTFISSHQCKPKMLVLISERRAHKVTPCAVKTFPIFREKRVEHPLFACRSCGSVKAGNLVSHIPNPDSWDAVKAGCSSAVEWLGMKPHDQVSNTLRLSGGRW